MSGTFLTRLSLDSWPHDTEGEGEIKSKMGGGGTKGGGLGENWSDTENGDDVKWGNGVGKIRVIVG